MRTIAEPAGATRLATSDTSPTSELELLYAQSAQLESLLAMARDDHVSSGTSAALSDGLDAQVASIDAELMRTDLSPAEQVAMWRRRVEALRALASFESTQRWFASQGGQDHGQLVVVD
jgi:S-adenosylmethionine:diacylglycerol 3-amino-3-carboxypropyl transferase